MQRVRAITFYIRQKISFSNYLLFGFIVVAGMREIKFRVLATDKDWKYFSLGDLVCGDAITHEGLQYNTDTWCQYTGLKDKNGKEIYEGDIVLVNESHKLLRANFDKNKRLVQWRQGGACLDMLHVDYLESERKVGLTFDNGMVDSTKVIGNVHENSNLLDNNQVF